MSDPSETKTDSVTGGKERHGDWYRKLVEEANDVTVVVDSDGTVTVSVEREGAVAVVVDGVHRDVVDRGAAVRIDRAGSLDVVAPTGTENF